jgi:transcriptional regulator with XRE-family HTH domain
MKTNKLKEKYTSKELADAFVFRTKLSAKEKKESDAYLSEMRNKEREKITPTQLLLSRLLQLKYQMEDYLTNDSFKITHSFGFYLREYLNSLNKKNKEFARDIDIDETELSQILNNHRKPSEKIIIRLEIHSSKTIPAITWFRLLEKEKEHEIRTNTIIRKNEGKHVKNRLRLSI